MDDDDQHVVLAHDCTDARDVHILRWPTWQAVDGKVTPSYDCGDCGLHTFVGIEWREVPAPAPVGSHEGSDRDA